MNLYKHRLDNNQSDLDSKLGYMRCLEALGEWTELGNYAKDQWTTLGEGPFHILNSYVFNETINL